MTLTQRPVSTATATDQVYRVVARTTTDRVLAVLLIAGSPDEAEDKARAQNSLWSTAPRVVATATAEELA